MAKIFYAARDRGDFAWRCDLGSRWLYRLRRWQDSPPRISKRTATAEKICRRATTLGDDRAVDRALRRAMLNLALKAHYFWHRARHGTSPSIGGQGTARSTCAAGAALSV